MLWLSKSVQCTGLATKATKAVRCTGVATKAVRYHIVGNLMLWLSKSAQG